MQINPFKPASGRDETLAAFFFFDFSFFQKKNFEKSFFEKKKFLEKTQKKRGQSFVPPGGRFKGVNLDLALPILNLIYGTILAQPRLEV